MIFLFPILGRAGTLTRALNRADPAGCSALMHACCPPPNSIEGDGEEGEENLESGHVCGKLYLEKL